MLLVIHQRILSNRIFFFFAFSGRGNTLKCVMCTMSYQHFHVRCRVSFSLLFRFLSLFLTKTKNQLSRKNETFYWFPLFSLVFLSPLSSYLHSWTSKTVFHSIILHFLTLRPQLLLFFLSWLLCLQCGRFFSEVTASMYIFFVSIFL